MPPLPTDNVILLTRAKALKETLNLLHDPSMQALIYAGAVAEFKRAVAPAIRDVLTAKGATKAFQEELLSLLEQVYAVRHIDASQEQTLSSALSQVSTE